MQKIACNQEAKDAHARLAKYHSRVASDPDFVPFEKASRHGQAGSYWAAAHLSNKAAAEEEDAIAADEAGRRLAGFHLFSKSLQSGNGPVVAKLLRDIFPTVDDDTFLMSDDWNI